MDAIYTTVKSVCLWMTAGASIWAGLGIFSRWNRGEDVTASIFTWSSGLIIANLLVLLVGAYIVGDTSGISVIGTNVNAVAQGGVNSFLNGAIFISCAISIIQIIRIYREFTTGQGEPTALFVQWFGSILFIFSMQYIIQAII